MAAARGAGTVAVKPDVDVAGICEGGAFRRCPPFCQDHTSAASTGAVPESRQSQSSHFKEGVIKVFCDMVCPLQNLRTNAEADCKDQARSHLPCTKTFKVLLKRVLQVVHRVYQKADQDRCSVLQELSSAERLGTLSSTKADEHLCNPPVSQVRSPEHYVSD